MSEHLDEGSLQGFLDDELAPAARDAAKAHLDTCARCRRELAALEHLAPEVRRRVQDLDLPPRDPGEVLWEVRRRRAAARTATHRRRIAAAASVILVFGVGLAAAAPGSPIRDWWEDRWAVPPVAPVVAPAADAAAEEITISLEPLDERVLVAIEAVRPGDSFEIQVTDAERATVSAPAGARFDTGAGRVQVDLADAGDGVIRIRLPERARSELRVDAVVYLTLVDGELDWRGPAPLRAEDGLHRFEVPDSDPGAEAAGTPSGDGG